jgi:phosphoribosylaminoimidazole-succinocarboxamide synthase
MAYGQCFEPGLKYGAKLADTVFTPKIRSGHVPLEFQDGLAVIGLRPMEKGLIAYQSAYEYALSCGIVIADTNFEMGTRPESELLSFGGDILTPDSSRYWDEDVYKEYWVGGKRPEKVELEHLREYARSIGIQKLDPKKPYDRRCVRALPVPVDICNMTTMIFSQIMIRITKKDLISYQEQDMNIT